MKVLALLVLGALVLALAWQELRYLRLRRGRVQDQQPLLYPRSTFHVLTLLRCAEGDDPLDALRKLRSGIEAGGRAKLVYAGRAAAGLDSSQLGEGRWDAVVLVQHPSRSAYDELASSGPYHAALGRFAATYSHGMDRPVLLNLALPVVLLGLRVPDVLSRRPPRLPFRPLPPEQRDERTRDAETRLAGLDALRELGGDAVVVVNLVRHGTAEQRGANRRYGREMARLFAEQGHGPMHMGRAIPVERDARFDQIALVYYPGIDYVQSMVRSAFFNGIVGGKQLNDTLALFTVPVLGRL